jgi:hypothetical protein
LSLHTWFFFEPLFIFVQTWGHQHDLDFEQLCLEPEIMHFFDLYNQDVSSCPYLLDFLIQQILTLRALLLYMAWWISCTQASSFLFSITSSTSTPSLPLALLRCMVHRSQALVDPSSITIMIHTTLCVFNEHTLVVIINSFSSFSLDENLLVFMMLRIYNHIGHNICLVKWIASIHSQDIFPISHLAKLISTLIVLSFKHQNSQRGLDALSVLSLPLGLRCFWGRHL